MTQKTKKKLATLPCIVCQKELQDVGSGSVNHPSGGLTFNSHGQYGTTVFDPIDGSAVEINVCDECMIRASKRYHVMFLEPPSTRYQRTAVRISYWDGKG